MDFHSRWRRQFENITRIKILFAGLIDEPMKGFEIVYEACRNLWNERQDFELLATTDPPGQVTPFLRYVGWQSQEMLPKTLWDADILVFPTIAEEALGRTAVEAMGAGRPVVASRIGGLPFTVTDGLTGLLFEPGNPRDLVTKLVTLLDHPELRESFGKAGRQQFEARFKLTAFCKMPGSVDDCSSFVCPGPRPSSQSRK